MDALVPELPQRPPIAQAPLSVILLADGPTSEAADSLSAWQTHVATLDRPAELLLLPLTDAEPNPVLAAARRLDYDPARGYGSALRAAFQAAQHPLIVLATADRQYQPADLQQLLGVIDHVDIAVGCRRVAPAPWWWRVLRWLIAQLGRFLLGLPPHPTACTAGATPWRRRWVARWAFGIRLRDPESAFRLLRRDAVIRIVLQSRGPFALVEQLAKANHLELIMTEEPVAWSPRTPLPAESVPFAQEVRALFRRPDFGPPELHIPPPAPLPPTEKPDAVPTTPPSPSS